MEILISKGHHMKTAEGGLQIKRVGLGGAYTNRRALAKDRES